MKIRSLLLSFAVAITTTASTPVKQQFSAAEQQQISIATPGLFKSYDAFNFDFGTLRGIVERLHEAAERGLWAEPDPEVLAEMQRIYLDVEGDLEEDA